MTNEQKIQMLTGATAVVLDNGKDRFRKFETLTAEQAEQMVTSEDLYIEITEQGNLSIGQRAFFGTRWVFPDKSLAVIAQ